MFEETLKFYQNFPKEGINFVDIMPFMQDKEVFTKLIGEIGRHVTAPTVAAPEARAFLFCAPLLTSDSGVTNVVPFRKKGKLPHSGDDLQSIEIMKEYGPDNLYFRKSDIAAGKAEDGIFKVAIIDDVISTGSSIEAIEKLVRESGGEVIARAAVLAEGDAADRSDIIYLEKIPLFFHDKK